MRATMKNWPHDEISKAIALLNSAKEFFDLRGVDDTDKQAKRTTCNQAQTSKHNKRRQRREDNKSKIPTT